DSVAVSDGERVERGQTIGGVGASGRATGPHLHFGAQVGAARVDPTALLGLTLGELRRRRAFALYAFALPLAFGRAGALFFALRLGSAFALGLATSPAGLGAAGILGPDGAIGGIGDGGGADVGIQGWGSPYVRSIVSSMWG